MLTIVDGKYSRNIDLDNISDTMIRHGSFGVASVIVSTATQNHSLIGLQEPEKLTEIIEGVS